MFTFCGLHIHVHNKGKISYVSKYSPTYYNLFHVAMAMLIYNMKLPFFFFFHIFQLVSEILIKYYNVIGPKDHHQTFILS